MQTQRQQDEARYLEIKRKWCSRAYGRMWKPSAPLSIRIEFEQLVERLTGRPHTFKVA